jgi:hypothetical protein
MAYNPTPPPPPTSNNKSRLPRGKSPRVKKPFVEAVEPTPSPALGDIKFQKIIYSQNSFRKKVDVSISELKPKDEEIDIPKFFANYHKLFFDLPQKGINSHSTLIRESMDFVNDYVDFKDEQIEDLNQQVKALNQQILDLQTAAIEGEDEDIAEEIEDQAIKIKADTEIGNPSDPNIHWSKDSARLLFPDGLKEVGKHMIEGNSQKLPNGADVFEGNKNKIDSSYRDLKEAYEKGGDGNIRQLQEIRTYSEWKSDIKDRAGGTNTKRYRNCIDCLDYVRDIVKQTYEDITS